MNGEDNMSEIYRFDEVPGDESAKPLVFRIWENDSIIAYTDDAADACHIVAALKMIIPYMDSRTAPPEPDKKTQAKERKDTLVSMISSRNGKKLIAGLVDRGMEFDSEIHNFHIRQYRGQRNANITGDCGSTWTLDKNAAYSYGRKVHSGGHCQVELNGKTYREIGSFLPLYHIVRVPPEEWTFYDEDDVPVNTMQIFTDSNPKEWGR